jgi:hypothetical protein
MRCVFDFIYTPSRSGFKFAVILTHVSHLWREMVIGAPILWTWFSINLRKPIPEILSFWDCMHKRVQGIPPIVILRSIGEGDGSALAACPIISFPKICSLKLVITDDEYARHLLSGNFPSLTSVETLEMVGDKPAKRTLWNERILERFRDLLNLVLSGFIGRFEDHPVLHDIRQLRAHEIASYDFIPHLRYYNNLLSIDLNLLFWFSVPNPVVLPLVHSMKVSRSHLWLKSLSCPKLKKLDVDSIGPTVIKWLKLHGTIEEIWVREVRNWEELAASAPQLLHLSVTPTPEDLHNIMELFHKLLSVTTKDANGIMQSIGQ